MSEPDLESLLASLSADAPCGPNLEYDPAFLALQEAVTGRSEQQFGDTVIPAVEPDWQLAHEHALKLAGRTRDLRLAVWLIRSGAHLRGLAGVGWGLELLRGLLQRHWEHVHPQLDAADGNDATMRLNALVPLTHPELGLADLRAAALTAGRASLRLRDIELAIGHAEPFPGETAPTERGVLQALAAALARSPELGQQMQSTHDAAAQIASLVEPHVTTGPGPDFAPLLTILRPLVQASARAAGSAEVQASPFAPQVQQEASTHPAAVVPSFIVSRADAVSALDRVCAWIESNEPSHPAPLLIRRARRLMSKSFIEIVRDLLPEGADQIEKLAGPAAHD